MKTAFVFLANGFEEIEAITPIDMMRRADINVVTVGVGSKTVTGAHGIVITADIDAEGFELPQEADLVFLPGGAGFVNLQNSQTVIKALKEADGRGLWIAAICAAPKILHANGLLKNKSVTAFPAVQSDLDGCTVTGSAVEIDGKIITGRSAGVALMFAKALVEALQGKEITKEVFAQVYPEI